MDAPEPMLCLLVPTLPEGDEWCYEIKWDGYRAIGIKEAKAKCLTSRNLKSLSDTFPQVLATLDSLKCKSAVVDGEVIALGENGRPSFNKLQKHKQHANEVRYVLFDLLALNGKDLTRLPLEKRREKLGQILPDSGLIGFSQELPQDAEALMQQASELGLEGIVAKRRQSVYEAGQRTGAWSKWKAERKELFYVGGYMPGGEFVIGKKEKEGLRYVARVKAGFVPRTRKELMTKLTPLRTSECPFFNLPQTGKGRWGDAMTKEKMELCQWVQPLVRIRVAFVEWTEAGQLRHSRFLGTL